MDELSRQLFALLLAVLWYGFGLYGLARMAARSPQGREMLARLRRRGPLAQAGTNAVNALYFGPLPEGAPGGAGWGSLSAPVWRVNGGASPPGLIRRPTPE